MDDRLSKLVEGQLQVPVPGARRVALGDLVVSLGPGADGALVLTVGRPRGRVAEREAVDVAVQVHRLIDRAGAAVDPEMLAYRGPEGSRCFVIGVRERATA